MAGKILIVGDMATIRNDLEIRLSDACYETLHAASGAQALHIAQTARPDVILLDVMLPDGDGIDICQHLKTDPRTGDIPVVIIATINDTPERMRAFQAGADDLLSKPVDALMLMARLRNLLRARDMAVELRPRENNGFGPGLAEAAQPFVGPERIAFITAQPEQGQALCRILARHLGNTFLTMDRQEALTGTANGLVPDVFVIATTDEQPEAALQLMSDLRSRPRTRHAAICILLPEDMSDMGAMALDLGAADLLSPLSDPHEIALRLNTQLRRKRQADRYRTALHAELRLSTMDPLTGLYNRRYALPHLARIIEHAHQSGQRYAVMVLDIDRFKSINDTWGHATGDTVLTEVARRLHENLRSIDLLARIGGEEFLVVLPDTTLKQARRVAERLCTIIEASPIGLPDVTSEIRVTLSIGLALGGGEEDPLESSKEVIARADHALLQAKSAGRNRVMVNTMPSA